MKTSSFATAAVLVATSYAATVTLETTACLDPRAPSGWQLEVEMNSGPVARDDLTEICGLRIVSASDGVDANTISCQAFKDIAGTQPGSAVFTYASPALIATNLVQEKAIKCTYPTTNNVRRQFNETSSPSASVPVSTALSSTTLPASSDAASSGVSSSAAGSTVTSMVVVTPSSALPSPSGNSTTVTSVMSRPTPSQSSQPSETPGAASSVGVGMGVVAAALVAMFA